MNDRVAHKNEPGTPSHALDLPIKTEQYLIK